MACLGSWWVHTYHILPYSNMAKFWPWTGGVEWHRWKVEEFPTAFARHGIRHVFWKASGRHCNVAGVSSLDASNSKLQEGGTHSTWASCGKEIEDHPKICHKWWYKPSNYGWFIVHSMWSWLEMSEAPLCVHLSSSAKSCGNRQHCA